jgi:PEP-CTERM motif
MFKFLPVAAAAVALSFAAVPAAEAAVTFSGNVANVTANNSGSGLEVQTGLYNSFNFDLDVGENSGPIGLFTIWTNETHVAWGEDTSPRNIAVQFNFLQPGGPWAGGPVEGETFGFNFIIGQGGAVTWDAPEIFTFGNGGQLKVTLNPTTFNEGWFGTTPGKKYGAVVTGNFEFLQAPSLQSGVPEPATWAMMITGFGLAGAAIRRRRTSFAVAA